MGRSGRHRHTATFTTTVTSKSFRSIVLAAAGITAVAVALIAIAVTGGPASSSAASGGEAADPPRALDRVSRGAFRTPPPTPTPDVEPSETPPEQPEPAPKKKVPRRRILSRGACEASYYGSGGHTASGEAFDPAALTAAHRTLPLGSKVRVINRNNDRSVIVRINDRGPFVAGRCLDLSSAAMHAVGGLASGVIPVRYEVLAKV